MPVTKNSIINNTTNPAPVPVQKGRPKLNRNSSGGLEENIASPLQSSENKILAAIGGLTTKIDEQNAKMDNQHQQLQQAISTQNSRIETLALEIEAAVQRVTKCEENILKSGSAGYDAELERLQIEIRKLNLILVGFQEMEGESDKILQDTIANFCTNVLQINDVMIDLAYRIGRKNDERCRPIKVRFCSLNQRNQILGARNLPRAEAGDRAYRHIFVNEDLPPVTQERRRLLRAHCKSANAAGASTRLLGDKLWIGDVAYIIDNNELVQFKTNTLRHQPSSSAKRQRDSIEPITPPGNTKPSPSKRKPKKKANTREFNFAYPNTGRSTFSSSSLSSNPGRPFPSSSSSTSQSSDYEASGTPKDAPNFSFGGQLKINDD